MSFYTGDKQTGDKLKSIEEGVRYLSDLNLIDMFYDKIWIEDTIVLLDTYLDDKTYHDLALEETDKAKQQVIEWFGDDYGLASIKGEFWMVSIGAIEEGGHQWWYKIKINTDDSEIARKVIKFYKLLKEK